MLSFLAGFFGGIVGAFFALACMIVFGVWMSKKPPVEDCSDFYSCRIKEKEDEDVD
ncbi:MAG: hypothetical protein M0R80_07890 [Proteobacteria bacterium]|jgi:hypothetical protein|nr:hypothetical protein [Pseudomonadota bacterium]